MDSHPFAFIKAFHGIGGYPDVELLLHKLVRHTVIMPIDFHMIINMDRGFFPLGKLIAGRRQRF